MSRPGYFLGTSVRALLCLHEPGPLGWNSRTLSKHLPSWHRNSRNLFMLVTWDLGASSIHTESTHPGSNLGSNWEKQGEKPMNRSGNHILLWGNWGYLFWIKGDLRGIRAATLVHLMDCHGKKAEHQRRNYDLYVQIKLDYWGVPVHWWHPSLCYDFVFFQSWLSTVHLWNPPSCKVAVDSLC